MAEKEEELKNLLMKVKEESEKAGLLVEKQLLYNITHYQRNANQNCNEISPHTGQNGPHQKIYTQ